MCRHDISPEVEQVLVGLLGEMARALGWSPGEPLLIGPVDFGPEEE